MFYNSTNIDIKRKFRLLQQIAKQHCVAKQIKGNAMDDRELLKFVVLISAKTIEKTWIPGRHQVTLCFDCIYRGM